MPIHENFQDSDSILFTLQGDLAARNVLLTHDRKAKVADFGLSTSIYINTSERKGSKQKVVPLQWTAYEILKNKAIYIVYKNYKNLMYSFNSTQNDERLSFFPFAALNIKLVKT